MQFRTLPRDHAMAQHVRCATVPLLSSPSQPCSPRRFCVDSSKISKQQVVKIEAYLAAELLLCEQTVSRRNQGVLCLLGLHEQVTSTDGFRRAVFEELSGDVTPGSLCGTGVVT